MNLQEDFFRGNSPFEKGIRCSAEIPSTVCLLYTETQILAVKKIIKIYTIFYIFNVLTYYKITFADKACIIKIYTNMTVQPKQST